MVSTFQKLGHAKLNALSYNYSVVYSARRSFGSSEAGSSIIKVPQLADDFHFLLDGLIAFSQGCNKNNLHLWNTIFHTVNSLSIFLNA